jgi:hypothetical protein
MNRENSGKKEIPLPGRERVGVRVAFQCILLSSILSHRGERRIMHPPSPSSSPAEGRGKYWIAIDGKIGIA